MSTCSAFCPRGGGWGGQNEIGWIGGSSTYLCAKHCDKLGGSGAYLENFDFGPFIRHNLVESGKVFTHTKFTIECVIKAFLKA